MPLYWLAYRRNDQLVGVVIVEAGDLLQARFRANVEGIDQDADFAQGRELDEDSAALVSARMIGRMLTPDEAAG